MQPVGMTTPGSGLKIEKRNLKGVDSFGMLCSAHDIGWSGSSDELVVLPEETEVGAPCPDKAPKVREGGGSEETGRDQGGGRGLRDRIPASFQ